jgi:hypothetical protein
MYHFFVADDVMMVGENGIRNYNIDDALNRINQSEYGAHHLVVYSNQRVLIVLRSCSLQAIIMIR